MTRIVAAAVTAILVALAALHVFWGLGGRTAFVSAIPTVGGRPQLRPGPLACYVVALLLATAAGLVAARAGLWLRALPAWMASVGTAGVALVFALRAVGDFRLVGFFKSVRGTRFATLDDWIYSPLCLALAVACAIVALRREPR